MSVGKKSQDSAHFKRQHKKQTATALERFAPLLHVWPVCNENVILPFILQQTVCCHGCLLDTRQGLQRTATQSPLTLKGDRDLSSSST